MDSVGTNAELMNGRKIKGYEKPPAPSTVFAESPAIIAVHVNAKVKSVSIPITANHDTIDAEERKPMRSATRIMTTTDIALETSDVIT